MSIAEHSGQRYAHRAPRLVPGHRPFHRAKESGRRQDPISPRHRVFLHHAVDIVVNLAVPHIELVFGHLVLSEIIQPIPVALPGWLLERSSAKNLRGSCTPHCSAVTEILGCVPLLRREHHRLFSGYDYTIVLPRHWDDAKLLHHAHRIDDLPFLNILAIHDLPDRHPRDGHLLAGGRDVVELALVRAGQRPVRRPQLPLRDRLLKLEIELERRAKMYAERFGVIHHRLSTASATASLFSPRQWPE
jgi:hypothetical protein